MSRSHHARDQSFGTLSPYAAIGCMLVLTSACRFGSAPSEVTATTDAGTSVEANSTTTPGGAAVPAAEAAAAQATGKPIVRVETDSGTPRDAADGAAPPAAATPAPTSSLANTPITTPPAAGSAAPRAPAPDAGTLTPPIASGQAPHAISDQQCSADLSTCLLRDPLNYAECLRKNAENNCPEPDAGAATMTPVIGEDGTPISQACQAELASCIMRLPTPENAASCTDKARQCKP